MREFLEVSHKNAVRLALAQYVGMRCTICGHEFNSVEDIEDKNPKCSGKDEKGIKLACRECFLEKFPFHAKVEGDKE